MTAVNHLRFHFRVKTPERIHGFMYEVATGRPCEIKNA
jgi:hypothetical protein